MTDPTIYEYQVYCIEEDLFVTTYGTVEPTLCPNDHADRTIDTNLTAVLESYDPNKVLAEENTEGDFTHESLTNNIPTGTVGDETIHDEATWATNNLIWNTRIYPTADMIGDFVKVRGIKNDAPNYNIVGTLTANVEIGENTLNVTKTVTDNVYKGMEIELDNTVIKENLGRITDIDTVNDIITVENTATSQFVAGSMVRVEVFIINQCIFTDKWPIEIGMKGMKGKKLNAGDIFRVKYTNNSGAAKTLHWDVEYYNLDSAL